MERNKRRRLGAGAWRELLARFPGSGLTAQAFCRREAVSTASFYRWRTLLGDAVGGDLVRTSAPTTATSRFVDLGTLSAAGARLERFELRIDLGGGLQLHLVRG